MIIYIFTILLLFTFSLLEENIALSFSIRRMMYIIVYLLLVIQMGLRWETGTDWYPYLRHFESINEYSRNSIPQNQFEYGYNLLVWITKLIFSNYSFFLLVHAIIYYLLIFKSFKRYTPYLFLSLLMFYTLSMGMMGSNRQLIAVAIGLYAIRYIIEKKPVLFFLLILIAISFHTTAFLFIIYYFLDREINLNSLILILGCSFIIFVFASPQISLNLFSFIGKFIGGTADSKTSFYLGNAKDVHSEYSLSTIGLIKRLVFLSFFYYNRKIISNKLPYYNIMLNGYIIGLVFYFLFAHSLLVMVSRGSLYFNMMEPLLISSQMILLKRNENKVALIFMLFIFSIFFFFQSITTYQDLFVPYKGIFINTGFHRAMY